jgi:mRNA-degrading endonuclease RelE of RelBE toxin-antitoxin system
MVTRHVRGSVHPKCSRRLTVSEDAIDQQLVSEPLTQTRNRKPLRPNDLATWEMRVGSHRVFYDVDEEGSKVTIKAVGLKEHNKLFIRGKEYQL